MAEYPVNRCHRQHANLLDVHQQPKHKNKIRVQKGCQPLTLSSRHLLTLLVCFLQETGNELQHKTKDTNCVNTNSVAVGEDSVDNSLTVWGAGVQWLYSLYSRVKYSLIFFSLLLTPLCFYFKHQFLLVSVPYSHPFLFKISDKLSLACLLVLFCSCCLILFFVLPVDLVCLGFFICYSFGHCCCCYCLMYFSV